MRGFTVPGVGCLKILFRHLIAHISKTNEPIFKNFVLPIAERLNCIPGCWLWFYDFLRSKRRSISLLKSKP